MPSMKLATSELEPVMALVLVANRAAVGRRRALKIACVERKGLDRAATLIVGCVRRKSERVARMTVTGDDDFQTSKDQQKAEDLPL